MRLTIHDSIGDPYQKYAQQQGRTVEEVCEAQLRRFAYLEPGKRTVTIPAQLEGVIADRLGGLPLKDGEDLVARLEKFARISFMGIDLQLTPNQLAEIQHRADRQGRPVADLVHDVWRSLQEQFFYSMAGGEAAPVKKSA